MFHLFIIPSLQPLATIDLFTVFIVFIIFQNIINTHIHTVIQYVALSDWLLSLSNMHFSFLHVFSWLVNPFPFCVE